MATAFRSYKKTQHTDAFINGSRCIIRCTEPCWPCGPPHGAAYMSGYNSCCALQVYDKNRLRLDTLIGQASFRLQAFREQLLSHMGAQVGGSSASLASTKQRAAHGV